jgi:alcohol-forming fatty acyl-CoA reductase
VKLLKQGGNPFSKLTLVAGDLQKHNLGISPEDQRNLINDVEIVFHAAADVRFDESLREATEINIRGTREIMLLSQRMLNLNVFIYVSTAYCTPGFKVQEKCETS